MNIIRLILFISIALTALHGYSSEVKARSESKKLMLHKKLLIPFQNKWIYEDYTLFKGIYWLHERDTLHAIHENLLKGKKDTIDIKQYPESYDLCDPNINSIRNSQPSRKYFWMIDDSCRKYIGYKNKMFHQFRQDNTLERDSIARICHDDFILVMENWFKRCNEEIKRIYERQKMRAEWARQNPDSMDTKFIKHFIIEYSESLPDKQTFIEITIANPRDLITQLDRQKYPYEIKYMLRRLPQTERLTRAIETLEESHLKGKTYRKVLKSLKRK